MPRVSVITGYYNRGEHLERTVRSILDQTYRDLELIVFDDASTDDTAQRLADLQVALNDPRLRVIIHERNRGFTQGMIDAIGLAGGEYIAVQGSGDFSLPRRVERQVSLLDSRPDVGAVGTWYCNVVADSGLRRLRQPDADSMTLETLLKRNTFSHGEVMFRRSVYDAVGGYRSAFKNAQDYDLWLRIVKVARLATVTEHLYDRYVRYDGVSYDPKKFPTQARYFLLAQRIAAMGPSEGEALLGMLATGGPGALVAEADEALQRRYFSAAFRSIAWGAYASAASLARNHVRHGLHRATVLVLAQVLSAPQSAFLRTIVRSALGVK